MTISNAYQDTLKRRAVQRFVAANNRAPTETELKLLVQTEQTAYPNVDSVGIVGYDAKRPQFRDHSSVAIENANRQALLDDMQTLSTRLDNLGRLMEDSFRGFYATSRQTFEELDRLEDDVDTLLLVHGSADVFLEGLHEDFHSQEFVDWSQTTAQVENGYVTLARRGLNTLNLDRATIRTSVVSQRGVLSSNATAPKDTLKSEDGRFWQFLANTTYSQGRVSLVIEVEPEDAVYVGDLRLYLAPIAANKPLTASVFYSLDGSTYTALDPVEMVVDQQEIQFNVGRENVHKIQIVLSKEAADSQTTSRTQWVYVWMLDAIQIFTDRYTANSNSTLVAGPYAIEDSAGQPVRFTKARFEACTIEPEDTSVSFSLSTDGTTWLPAAHDGDGLSYVSFGNASRTGHVSFVDAAVNSLGLIEQPGILNLDLASEAVLNAYIPSVSVEQVATRGITLKRNVKTSSSPDELLGTLPGWGFDPTTNQHTVTVYVQSPEGRYIDFGPAPIRVNGQLVSGNVFLPAGYSTFGVMDSNWQSIPAGLTGVEGLRNADSLYPYNHRYLLEGYEYPSAFQGEQVYTGADDFFGQLMTYVPPEVFDRLDAADERYYKVFTFAETAEGKYLKLKVNKTDSSWSQELFDSDWVVQSRADNQLYVRAILNSSDTGCTPQIDSFKVMVI